MSICFRSGARLCPTYRLLDRLITRPSFLLLLPVVAYSSCFWTSRKMSDRFTSGIISRQPKMNIVPECMFLMRSCIVVYKPEPEHKTLRAVTTLYSSIYI